MSEQPPTTPGPSEKDIKRLRVEYGLDKVQDNTANYSAAGMELAMIVCGMAAAGWALDYWLDTLPWFLLGGALFGIFGGLYRLILRFGR